MTRTMNRARVAVGAAVVAVAGFGAAGSLSAAPESAPPSTTPDSSEPVDTAGDSAPPMLDPEREELVDAIVVSAGDSGFPLDRDCVAGLVAQIPDEDLVIVSEDIATMSETAIATAATMPEYTVGSDPADTSSVDTMVTETEAVDTAPIEPAPAVSPVTEEIGQQMIACAHGDADPALVEDALAVIQADPDAPSFDMACVASVLTTFSDETLTLIIEDDDAAPTETAASVEVSVETVVPETAASESVTDPAITEPVTTEETGLVVEETLSSIPDEMFTEALSLLICAPELLGEFDTMGADVATASAPEPVMETAPADTTTG
jgi:hypothetical protein